MMDGTAIAAKRLRTQWATQFLVAAELARRGFTVTFTLGNNTPVADLAVGSATGCLFWVDVKGLSSESDWLLRPKAPREQLFYVLCYLAPVDSDSKRDRFFVLTQSEANSLEEAYFATHPHTKRSNPGFSFRHAFPHENRWDKLPA